MGLELDLDLKKLNLLGLLYTLRNIGPALPYYSKGRQA